MKRNDTKKSIIYGNDSRWREIQDIIMGMALFNFTHEIPFNGKDDPLEAARMGLKLLAEELYCYFVGQGQAYCTMNALYRFNSNFILDGDGKVLTATNTARALLGLSPKEGVNIPLTSLLIESSKSVWLERLELIHRKKIHDDKPMVLEFLAWDNAPIPHLCNYAAFIESENGPQRIVFNIIPLKRVESLSYSKGNMILESAPLPGKTYKRKPRGAKMKYYEIQWCRHARKQILANIRKVPPSTEELARLVGTNIKSLRSNFKLLYGMTIGQFIVQSRLELALPLVQFSDMDFKDIAESSGFKSMPHFSTRFKKEYDHCPREYRKKVRSGEIIP